MKRMIFAVIILSAIMLVANQSYASGKSSAAKEGSRSVQSSSPARGQKTEAVRLRQTSKLNGMDVKNLQGENLGEIKDLVVNTFDGRVAYAIMEGNEGFLGIGDRMYAVPWKSLKPSVSGDELILDINKDRLAKAPYFDRNKWPNFADRNWEVRVYRYYGVSPYWEERNY